MAVLNSNRTVFAKTTRPELGSILPREALFKKLDGTPTRTVAWIAGPAGSGKSTLAASYLEARNYRAAWYQVDSDDEDPAGFFHFLAHAARRICPAPLDLAVYGLTHQGDLATYSRRFFRNLFAAAGTQAALVIDNLHALAADSPLRVVLEAGLTQVPRHCCVLVTCRGEPPEGLARLRAGGEMVYLGAGELRTTPEELAEIARLRGKTVSARTVQLLHERTQGWVAGLVLMLEHAKLSGDLAEVSADAAPDVVFDYLAGEIFTRFEIPVQRLLLRIACMPSMSEEIARAVSSEDKAGVLLLNLAHNDYFVTQVVGPAGRIYRLHPLLREFLLRRAAIELPEAVSATALKRAAQLLRDSGQADEAAALFIECRDWNAVADIAAEQADMLLQQGRRETLAGWLELLPPESLQRDPRLVYSQGLCRLQRSPRSASHDFEFAFAEFERRGDHGGMSLCTAAVLKAILLEFDDLAAADRWLASAESLAQKSIRFEPAAAQTIATLLMLRDPANNSLEEWLRRAAPAGDDLTEGPEVPLRTGMLVALLALLRGDFAAAQVLIADPGADPRDTADGVLRKMAAALYNLLDGGHLAAAAAAREGLAAAQAEGLSAGNSWLRMLLIAAALQDGDLEGARRESAALDLATLRRGERALAQILGAVLASRESDAIALQRDAKNALQLATEAGMRWFEWLARLLLTQSCTTARDQRAAETHARAAADIANRLESPLLRVAACCNQAGVALEFGAPSAAADLLAQGFALGRECAMRHIIGVRMQWLAAQCALALRQGIESEFARDLVRHMKLAPPAAALALVQWPWTFQITTLGGFSLAHKEEPIEFSAKGAGRPVELLKVLIAMGGQNVRADMLADSLWPHIDADYAYKSFTQTLHRLRQKFEDNDALVLSDGRLSLNRELFRADTWALEQLITELDALLRAPPTQGDDAALRALLETLLLTYRGPFLPDETEQPIYIACREQIRARLLRVITRLARRWEDSGDADAAADCYLRLIEADPLCEALYRNLMLCYQRGDRPAEAAATYERLRTVLAARLKTVPSPETESTYAALNLGTKRPDGPGAPRQKR